MNKVTRFEVINHGGLVNKPIGRSIVVDSRYDNIAIELSYQDDGRTLKVFLTSKDSG